jgi:hypothetical protein
MCGKESLKLWLDLGLQPLANSFLRQDDPEKEEATYPLRVFWCENRHLSQLVDIVNPEIMFRDYVYFSSGMPKVSAHWRAYAEDIVNRFATKPTDFVVELGSNDGVLIGEVQKLGRPILGIDPARNIAAQANERGIPTIPEFFSNDLAKKIRSEKGLAKAILGNNVVAHIDDYEDLLNGVGILLAPDGIFAFEAPYMVDMFENTSFDTVYHEHMSYLSLEPIMKWLALHGLEVFDAKLLPVQGNSLRVYASRPGVYEKNPVLADLLAREKELGMHTLESYLKLAEKIAALKSEVMTLLHDLKKSGKRIAAYGSPAKGNTLLNYYGISTDILEFATEELPSKVGFYTPGTHIPIVHIDTARERSPDYYLMLAWNYKDAILMKEKDYIAKGGKFILPIGSTRIIPN